MYETLITQTNVDLCLESFSSLGIYYLLTDKNAFKGPRALNSVMEVLMGLFDSDYVDSNAQFLFLHPQYLML